VFVDVHKPIIYKKKRKINGITKALLFQSICFLSLRFKRKKELATKTQIAIVFIDKKSGRVPTKR
jgi:hypothetical protein